jgi:hypothetical protein
MTDTLKHAPRRPRQNSLGSAYAGSQRHIQAYVNTPSLARLLDHELSSALAILQGSTIEWRAPLATKRYAEPHDATFWRAIGHSELAAKAAQWWPARGGPSWDAIGLAHRPGSSPVVVLVEAKANVSEVKGSALAATSPRSISTIKAALDQARTTLVATGAPAAWTGQYYQLANRIAWTLWLREQHVDAVFAHVLFEHDHSHQPTAARELTAAIGVAHDTLGIPPAAVAGWATTVVLPASP